MEKQDKYLEQLLQTKINETKGTRGEKVHRTRQRIDIMDMDLGTLNVGQTATPEYYKYIQTMVQAYDRYLGYSSGITANNVLLTLSEGIRLYCAMKLLKRYYDAQDVTLPSGEKVHDIYSKTQVISVDNEGSFNPTIQDRIDTSCKGVSNKVWVTDYINKVEQVLLPKQIMVFYDYYLSNMFDISNTDNKEAVTLMRFWISDEPTSFISKYVPSGGTGATTTKLTKTNFDGMFNSLESYLTPTMRNFVTTFLNWDKPNEDWTRDLQGNTLSIVRDSKLISTFNNVIPQSCSVIHATINPSKGAYDGSKGNLWQRYYYDFEQLYDNTDSDTVSPSTLYFGVDGLNVEQLLLAGNNILDVITIDYYNYLLLSMLCNEEANVSNLEYVGGINSVLTSIDCTNGNYFPTLYTEINDVKQFCYGNDISLKIYDFRINATQISHEFDVEPYPRVSEIGGIMGDYGEQGDTRDQFAIMQFPLIIKEYWRYAQRWTEDSNKKENAAAGNTEVKAGGNYMPNVQVDPVIDVAVNSSWKSDWTVTDQAKPRDYFVSHVNDKVAFTTYVMDPKEADLSIHTTMFKLLTGYRTYNEAVTFIDKLFSGKQQDNN